MKKYALFAAGALALSACQDFSQPMLTSGDAVLAASPMPADYVPGRIIVAFRPGADAHGVAAAQGGSLGRELLAGVRLMHVPVGREMAVVNALSHNPNVRYAEPDYVRQISQTLPTDKYFGYKWDLHNDGTLNNSTGAFVANTGKVDADIDWLEAYQQLGAFTGAAVIGIADTGINPLHEDLAGRVLPGYDFVNNDADPADDHGHGTHVAGTAAAPANSLGVPGVAYGINIKILPAKVCDAAGCPSSAIVAGIKYLADNGAVAINLSLGGRYGSASEQEALRYALSKNSLPLCASGNDRLKSVSYPAAFPECVAVGATDWSDTKASYSNSGTALDVSAPGGDSEDRNGYSQVLATGYTGNYVFMAGTSMATPQVAGLAGLLHAIGVTGASNIRARIEGSTDDLGTAGWDSSFGHGRISVYKAINDLR